MYFDLDEKLSDSIIFSMEDQTSVHLLDSKSGLVVEATDLIKEDNDRYYGLPEWNSKDGYALLEDFTAGLYQPQAKEQLRQVLISGRGVFRNFKNVLKQYPEVERRWHYFKNDRMHKRLMEWYNNLRTLWGLEELETTEIEDLSDLVQDDFEFIKYTPEIHGDEVARGLKAVTEECKSRFAGEVGDSIAAMWLRDSEYFDFNRKEGYVCHTQSNDFTGCALFSLYPLSAKKTVVLTDLFVLENYRGLGVGKELISKSLTLLKERGIRWVLVSNIIIQKPMETLLCTMGFDKIGTVFLLDLFKE